MHEHVENLRRKGYIRKSYNESRSIELLPARMRVSAVELPLFGAVAAGMPIEAIPDQETIAVPEDMLARGAHNYVLRVRGESMIDEQIRDGDYIIVNARETARNGEMVVALVGGESATVKKFYREPGGMVRLQPANPEMEPMYFPAAEVKVQGIVIGVYPEVLMKPRHAFLVGRLTSRGTLMVFLRPIAAPRLASPALTALTLTAIVSPN